MKLSNISISFLLLCSAHSTTAVGLRGVSTTSSMERELKKGGTYKTSKNCRTPCQEDPNNIPMVPCPAGFTVTFNCQACEFECRQLPASSLPQESERQGDADQVQVTGPNSGNIVYTTTNDSLPGATVESGAPSNGSPPPCPPGYSVTFIHKDYEWQCKKLPATSATAPQSRQATPSSPTARKSSSKLCQADPNRNPMVACPAGYTVMFNHKACEYQCKKLPASSLPVDVPEESERQGDTLGENVEGVEFATPSGTNIVVSTSPNSLPGISVATASQSSESTP